MEPSQNGAGRLINICGLPGSGKTTLATQLAADLGAIRFSSDDWMDALGINLWEAAARNRVEALQWDQAQVLLAHGLVVVIEWGVWTKAERERMRHRAHELGATAELRFLEAEPEVLFERISARGRENPPITRNDVDDWFTIFERPTESELARYDATG